MRKTRAKFRSWKKIEMKKYTKIGEKNRLYQVDRNVVFTSWCNTVKDEKNGIKAEHWCLAARWKNSAIVFRFWQCFLSGFQFNEHSPKEPTTKRVVHYRRIIKRQLVRQQRLLHSKKKRFHVAHDFFPPAPHVIRHLRTCSRYVVNLHQIYILI